MKKYSVILCVVFAIVACHLTEVYTTPLPPLRTYEDSQSDSDSDSKEDLLQLKQISSTKNKIRTKRGIPCPTIEDTECEWEINSPCGCDPCDALRHANEARMLRKQHRKIVAEMKINRLKRKIHSAVCPSCALAHEREIEHKPCNKPHVDITVVVPGGNQNGISEVPVPVVEYPSLPPPRQTYTQVVQTGSQVFTSDPLYNEPMVPQYEPMVPESQYEPMVPGPQFEPMVPRPQYGVPETQFEPMVHRPQYGVPETQFAPMVPRPQYGVPETNFEPMAFEPQRFQGFGPAVPWMRSAVDTPDTDSEKRKPAEEAFEQDTQRKIKKVEGLHTIFVENQNTSTEAPIDSDEAWPFKNATYHEAETIEFPSPIDITTDAPPYDSAEAVPFHYNGTPRAYDSGEAVPFNFTGSPRTYDSGEAVPFNFTGSPRAYDSGEAVPFNFTGSPRGYDSGEAAPFNFTGSPKAYDSEEAVPFNFTGSPRAYDSGEAVPFNFTGSPRAYDSGEVPFNFTGSVKAGRYPRDETSLRAPPIDDALWQTAYLAALKAVAASLNNTSSLDTLKSSDRSAVNRSCADSQCMKACLEAGCLENEVRQKRDTSSRMPFASALLTGLVSAVIGM